MEKKTLQCMQRKKANNNSLVKKIRGRVQVFFTWLTYDVFLHGLRMKFFFIWLAQEVFFTWLALVFSLHGRHSYFLYMTGTRIFFTWSALVFSYMAFVCVKLIIINSHIWASPSELDPVFALGNHSCLCPRIWLHPLPSDLVPTLALGSGSCLCPGPSSRLGIHSSLLCIFLCSPLVYPLLLFLFSSQYQCYLFPLINSTLPPIPFCSSVNNKNIALTPPSSPTPVPPPSFRHTEALWWSEYLSNASFRYTVVGIFLDAGGVGGLFHEQLLHKPLGECCFMVVEEDHWCGGEGDHWCEGGRR